MRPFGSSEEFLSRLLFFGINDLLQLEQLLDLLERPLGSFGNLRRLVHDLLCELAGARKDSVWNNSPE